MMVMDRQENKLLTGPLAPLPSGLLSWLFKHPSFEVLLPKKASKSFTKSLLDASKRPDKVPRLHKTPHLADVPIITSSSSSFSSSSPFSRQSHVSNHLISSSGAQFSKNTTSSSSPSINPLRMNARRSIYRALFTKYDCFLML